MEVLQIYQIVSERFISSMCAQLTPSEHPIAFATMGSPGAGKTTFLQSAASFSEGNVDNFIASLETISQLKASPSTVSFQNLILLNPENVRDFMAKQPEIQHIFHTEHATNSLQAIYQSEADPKIIQAFHDTGNRAVEKMVAILANQSVSFILDSTLDALSNTRGDRGKVEQLLYFLTSKQYQMYFFPIIVDADTALTRAEQAFNAGTLGYFNKDAITSQAHNTIPNIHALSVILDTIGANSHIYPFASHDHYFNFTPDIVTASDTMVSKEHVEL